MGPSRRKGRPKPAIAPVRPLLRTPAVTYGSYFVYSALSTCGASERAPGALARAAFAAGPEAGRRGGQRFTHRSAHVSDDAHVFFKCFHIKCYIILYKACACVYRALAAYSDVRASACAFLGAQLLPFCVLQLFRVSARSLCYSLFVYCHCAVPFGGALLSLCDHRAGALRSSTPSDGRKNSSRPLPGCPALPPNKSADRSLLMF